MMIRQRISSNLHESVFEGFDWQYDGPNAEAWGEAFNTLSRRRAFTNAIVDLIIDPSDQFFDISVPAFLAKLNARDVFLNLNSKDEGDRRWMENGGGVQESYTDYGMYNMTAVMWAEHQRIREAEADAEFERSTGWGRYDISPQMNTDFDDASSYTSDRPNNRLEYNYNEEIWYLTFGRSSNAAQRDGYCGDGWGCTGYNHVPLTSAYPDACWTNAGVGQYVVPFSYDYYSYMQYQVRV